MPATREARWMPAWLALVRTHTRLWEQVEAQMRRETGLTMARYDVLTHLDMSGGRLGLTDLASSILLSQSGLSKLLDRMEAAGLVRRDPDPGGLRGHHRAGPGTGQEGPPAPSRIPPADLRRGPGRRGSRRPDSDNGPHRHVHPRADWRLTR
jgi:hypothetical protein